MPKGIESLSCSDGRIRGWVFLYTGIASERETNMTRIRHCAPA